MNAGLIGIGRDDLGRALILDGDQNVLAVIGKGRAGQALATAARFAHSDQCLVGAYLLGLYQGIEAARPLAGPPGAGGADPDGAANGVGGAAASRAGKNT